MSASWWRGGTLPLHILRTRSIFTPIMIVPPAAGRRQLWGLDRAKAQLHSRQGTLIGVPMLLVAVILFCVELRWISLVNGWWIDELFSIWATDPSRGFVDVFVHRILPDTTPPLYYVLLFFTRRLMPDALTAITVLNVASLAVAFVATGVVSWRAGMLGWALATEAFFILSGPVLRYALEGRSYIIALSITFVASWYCALAVELPDKRPRLLSFGLVGVIAGFIHLFAAMFCGSLAAGLVGIGLLTKRKELWTLGLTLGISTCAIIVPWLSIRFAMISLDNMSWIEFSFRSLLRAYWDIKLLTLGSRPAFLLLVAFFGAGSMLPATRPLTGVFGLAFVFFLLLPILGSFVQPIIGRWWLVGAPAVVVFVSFVVRALFLRTASSAHARLCWVATFAGLTFFLITDISGFFAARAFTADKRIWSGVSIAAPLLQHCPPRSVHVTAAPHSFAFVAHAPEELFASVDENTPWIGSRDSTCPVLGWAEHIVFLDHTTLPDDYVLTASDDELLRLLKFKPSPRKWTSIAIEGGLLFYGMVHLFPAKHRTILAILRLVSLRDGDDESWQRRIRIRLFRQE